MTTSVPSAYELENENLQRKPIYKVTFDGITPSFSTHKLGTCKRYMQQPPSGSAATVKPEQGSSTIGSYEWLLLDRDDEITALVVDGLSYVGVTLEGGFKAIDESDFATFFSGVITSCKMNDDLTGYRFGASDPQALMNRQVFRPLTFAMTGSLDASRYDWYYDVHIISTGQDFQASSFLAPTDYGNLYLNPLFGVGNWSYNTAPVQLTNTTIFGADTSAFPASGYVIIDNEIASYSGNTGTSLTGVGRAALATTVAAHAVGASVRTVIIHSGHPIDIFIAVCTNTDYTGASIPSSRLDLAALAALKTAIGASYSMQFRIIQSVNLKQWAEKEIFAPLASYLTTTSDGKVSVKQFAAPVSAVATFDESNINERIKLTWDANFTSIINSVQFFGGYDPVTDKYAETSVKYEDAASIARYGEFPLAIHSKGFRFSLAGTTTLQATIADLILDRYASGGAPIVKATTFLQKNLVEPGDIVAVTSQKLPNRTTGKRGVVGALFEVINRKINFKDGSVDFELLWTSWNA